MQSSRVFFRYLAFALEILLLWVLQSTPKLMPEVFGAKPLLLLAAALSFAVCENAIPSLILGAVCGILADISAGGTVGYFAIAFTIVCFVISGLLGTYLNRNFLSGAVLSLGAVVLIMGLYFVFFRVFAGVPESGTLFVSRFLPRMAYTFLTFIPLYFLNRFLSKSFI